MGKQSQEYRPVLEALKGQTLFWEVLTEAFQAPA